MKVVSPQIFHKSDVGGVSLDLRDEVDVENCYARASRSREFPFFRHRVGG